MQNEYSKFLFFCQINWVKDFHLCCFLTQILFWLNTENNANPYIIKPPNLSSTSKCDNERQGILFS